MARKLKVESVEFSRTGKRSKSAKLETLARRQARQIKYNFLESGTPRIERGQN